MHVTIPYSSGTVKTVIVEGQEIDLPVPVYPSSGEITNPGEMAISTLDGHESICIKSDQNENVMFSDDSANQMKLSPWHNSANGGLALRQNNEHGPVLSLSEGVPLENQPIITNARTLHVAGHQQEEIGYSLTPLKDSESCVVYGFSDNLPVNLSEMKDIKINVRAEKSGVVELSIRNGTDIIKSIPFQDNNAFVCDSIHGLENVPPIERHSGGSITGETFLMYQLKYNVVGDITASFAASSETGCRAVASHAEGSKSTTFAVGSHTEGFNTSGHGEFSHSEGYESNTQGLCSSAHNSQTNTDSPATASSVYGFQNSVINLGEFACGTSNGYNVLDGRLFSVGDGICIDTGGPPIIQTQQCTPHSVFKIIKGGDEGNAYYYPLFDISNEGNITRNLVIKATVGGVEQTKTLDEWYEFLINGGN